MQEYVEQRPNPPSFSGSSGSGGSGDSSSDSSSDKNDNTLPETPTNEVVETSVQNAIATSSNNSDFISIGKDSNNNSVTYIKTDVINAADGYSVSKTMDNWDSSLKTGDCAKYDTYTWYVRDNEKQTIDTIKLAQTVIDYEVPTASISVSTKGIKFNPKDKDSYKWYTNDDIVFTLDSVNFGVSGKESLQYQVLTKDVKTASSNAWQDATTNTITVKPKGCKKLYVKLVDKAGNKTVYASDGFKSDYAKPKLKQKWNTVNLYDLDSGIKSISINGKKQKLKESYKLKAGKHSITAIDKAGNKLTKTVTVKSDKTKPTVKVSYNVIKISDKVSGIKSIKIDGKKKSIKKSFKLKVGKHRVTVSDYAGNRTSKTINVKADKVKPKVTVKKRTVKIKDSISGISRVYIDKVKRHVKSSYTLKPGKHRIVVYDRAGNKRIKNITIK